MEFKQNFNKEEIEDILQWFDTHTYEQDIDLGGGIHIRDIKKALPMLLNIARDRWENRSFAGNINILFLLREEFIKQGKCKEK